MFHVIVSYPNFPNIDGASLFYTTPLPATLQVLRQYALHLLFAPPAPSPGLLVDGAASTRNVFPFQQKPNTLDRDRIVVPIGWDSFGKIAVLRDGFDAKAWGEAWEHDLEPEEGETGETSAKKLYSSLVEDRSVKVPCLVYHDGAGLPFSIEKPPSLPAFNNPTPEQVFLAKNYDENSKKPDRDPRGAFRNPTDNPTAGIVGPMGSGSFNLPNVDRVLTEMEGGSSPPNPSVGKLPSRAPGRPSGSTVTVPPLVNPTTRAGLNSPTPNTSPGTEQVRHDVLQSFFQSLLVPKDRAGANAAARSTTPKPSSTEVTNGSEEGT
jgi:dynein light intermediate chain 1, cytosolic